MKRILVVLSILVVFMFPFSLVAQAEDAEKMEDYLQYDSFQRKYNEHLSELLYYAGVSYDSNDHYFQENIELYRQAVNETFDNTILNNTLNTFLDGMEYFKKPVALLSAADDLRKRLLDKIKAYFSNEEANTDTNLTVSTGGVKAPTGYYFKVGDTSSSEYDGLRLTFNGIVLYFNVCVYDGCPYFSQLDTSYGYTNEQRDAITSDINTLSSGTHTVGYFLSLLKKYFPDLPPIQLVKKDDLTTQPLYKNVLPTQLQNIYNRTVNNFNDDGKFNENYSPTITPQLVCPNGVIELDYTDGNFYTKQQTRQTGQLILIDSNETALYGSENCTLDFKFPTLEFNSITGDLTADGESLIPISIPPADDYDYSILAYIRNSYDYATSVISTGVNGLKSIATGTAGLVTFSGSLFGFLPPEILTLFIGGFSIALGLWVFKK